MQTFSMSAQETPVFQAGSVFCHLAKSRCCSPETQDFKVSVELCLAVASRRGFIENMVHSIYAA